MLVWTDKPAPRRAKPLSDNVEPRCENEYTASALARRKKLLTDNDEPNCVPPSEVPTREMRDAMSTMDRIDNELPRLPTSTTDSVAPSRPTPNKDTLDPRRQMLRNDNDAPTCGDAMLNMLTAEPKRQKDRRDSEEPIKTCRKTENDEPTSDVATTDKVLPRLAAAATLVDA
jgi:hypothetical protein